MSIFRRFSEAIHPTPHTTTPTPTSTSLTTISTLRARIPTSTVYPIPPTRAATLPRSVTTRLNGLSVPKYVERTNGWLQNLATKDATLLHIKNTLDGFYREAFHPNNEYIPIGELGRYRKYILQFFLSDHAAIKEKTLYYYIDLCESDPIIPETSEGLLECLQLLIAWNKDGSFKKLNNIHLPLVAKSFALTLECLLLHMEENLSGQKEEIKTAVSDFSSSLTASNIHNIEELSYWSNYIEQASILIQVENHETKENLKLAGEVLSLGIMITTAILTSDPAAMSGAMELAGTIAIDLVERFKTASSWFQQALVLKRQTRVAFYNEELFKKMSKIFKFTPLINNQATENQRFSFFSFIDNLEMAILRSPDESVRCDSLKMLIHFLYVNNKQVKARALQTLCEVARRGDEKLINTVKIILELIKHTEGTPFDHIQQRNQFYPDVIQYLMVRDLNIRFKQDIGGIPLVHLLSYANDHNAHFLEVFLRIPYIAKSTKDVKGNTPYHHAAFVGNVLFLEQYAKTSKECCKETQNVYGDRPIHIAIQYEQIPFFNKLLELKTNSNGLNGKRETPLHLAIRTRGLAIAETLCRTPNVQINALDIENKTPLNRAIEGNQLGIVDLLDGLKAEIAETKFKISPIALAAKLKMWDVVCYYLQKKPLSPLEMGEVIGMTATSVNLKFIRLVLHLVLTDKRFNDQFKQIQALSLPRFFSGNGRPIDITKTYFMEGIESSVVQKIKQKAYDDPIFDTQFDPNQKALNGLTLLMLLAQDTSEQAAKLARKIIAKGGNPLLVHESGLTVYHLVALFNNQKYLLLNQTDTREVLSLKVEHDPNTMTEIAKEIKKKDFAKAKLCHHTAKDSIGTTAVMELAAHKEKEAIDLADFLLTAYNNVNEKNLIGTSAVIAAGTHSNIELIKVLKKHQGNLNIACGQGYRLVHIAALYRHFDLAKFLLSENVEFECRNNYEETPLHCFCGMDPTFEPVLLDISPPNKKREKVQDELTPKSSPNLSTQANSLDRKSSSNLLNVTQEKKEEDPLELELLDLFLSRIDPTLKDANGNTCLHRAVQFGKNPKVIAQLLNACPALFWIANNQDKLPIDLLLDNKLRQRDLEKLRHLNCGAVAVNHAIVTSRGTMAHSAAGAMMLDFLKKLFGTAEGAKLSTAKNETNGQTPLHEAAKVGFTEMIDFYHDIADLQNKDHSGHTPLDYAALYSRLPFFKKLISLVPDAYKTTDPDGRTPLHQACVKNEGDSALLEYLVDELKMDCTATDNSGEIPMHVAARSGNLNAVLFFHKKDPSLVNIPNDYGLTTLHVLAMQGFADIICDLMTQDMTPSSPQSVAKSIHQMIQTSEWHTHSLPINVEEAPKLTIDATDLTSKTPLMVANNTLVVRALLLAGASQTKTNDLGETALHYACASLQLGSVEAIINYSKHHLESALEGNPLLKADSQNELPIHEVCKACDPKKKEDQLKILELLLDNGSPINPQEEGGRIPLHDAIKKGNSHLVQTLIRRGSNLTAQTHEGKTPLHKAAASGRHDCILLLQQNMRDGWNIKDNEGYTPLAVAALNGDYLAFKLLVRGENYKTHNRKGQNLYHILYANTDLKPGHRAILSYLFEIHPQGVYETDGEENTCFHVLAHKGLRAETTDLLNQMKAHPQRPNILQFMQKVNNKQLSPHSVATAEYRLYLNAQSSHLEEETEPSERSLSTVFSCLKL